MTIYFFLYSLIYEKDYIKKRLYFLVEFKFWFIVQFEEYIRNKILGERHKQNFLKLKK